MLPHYNLGVYDNFQADQHHSSHHNFSPGRFFKRAPQAKDFFSVLNLFFQSKSFFFPGKLAQAPFIVSRSWLPFHNVTAFTAENHAFQGGHHKRALYWRLHERPGYFYNSGGLCNTARIRQYQPGLQ